MLTRQRPPRGGSRRSNGHLEHIPSDHTQWRVRVRGAEALSQNLEAMREQSLLYRTLATLRRDVPLTESLSDLEWRGAPDAELAALCQELGEPSLVERLRAKHAT